MPRPVPVTHRQLEAIAATHGTPFQLYDEGAIRSNARSLISTLSGHFPGFKQFYAVKALPNPAILRVLISEGCGLDCSSASELHIASLLGVPGDSVMYTSNYTSKADLAVAFDQGVIINLDDISLVDHLVAVRGRCPELISFRLNPGLGRTDSETASNVLGGPDAKFGVPPFQILDAYRKARAAGSTRFGIHMMTGSCVLDSEYWRETVAVLIDTVAQVHSELGITFEFINIGGGLGIPYRPGQPENDVTALAASLKEVLSTRMASHALPFSPRLFMENGRYMTGPYGWLVSRCEVIKDTFQKYYGLDSCMSNLMRPGMYGAYHFISVPSREGGPRSSANVVGTLCENNDWFAKDRDLPQAQVGDLFVIHDTGAHSHSMGFQYNGKLRAPELLLRGSEPAVASESSTAPRVDLIRDRETIHCLYDNTRMPADLQAAAAGAPAYPYDGRPPPPAGSGASPAMTSSVAGPNTKKSATAAATAAGGASHCPALNGWRVDWVTAGHVLGHLAAFAALGTAATVLAHRACKK